MYKKSTDQLSFEDFYLPFSGKLDGDNRWVKLSEFVPWQEFEDSYSKHFSSDCQGAPAKPVRMALGALLIQKELGSSDEESVELIKENPYLQYFLGLAEFQTEAPFDPSMFVYFRKRFDQVTLDKINDRIFELHLKSLKANSASEKDEDDEEPANKGKLIIDATCVPSDVSYPTDLNLLNKSREKAESIIDTLHEAHTISAKKPRTYRRKARRDYLQYAKAKRLSKSKRRRSIRKQLGYVRRDLSYIKALSQTVSLSHLSPKQYRDLLVIQEVFRQQQEMYSLRVKRIDNRIVSIQQPFIRPIKRGKVKKPVEFGAKISVSVIEGFTFLDHLNWDSFNESGDLVSQVERFCDRTGYYPESVHADRIYRTRYNLKYCKEKGIRLSGPRLGRPPKLDPAVQKVIKKQQYQDEVDRIEVEGKFGVSKRRYGLDRIMTKLSSTSAGTIALTFLLMNLKRWLKVIFLSIPIRRLLRILLFEIRFRLAESK